ncbi:hypothetical protein PG991_001474 [Apiospora marii]|uniref:Uncharacterized protein n=1 Tax=Apiospora marii TaxID=335849 RepID=A0ABR1STZ8_9PEZI
MAAPPDWVSADHQNGRTNGLGLPADHPFNNYGRDQTLAPPPRYPIHGYDRNQSMAPPPEYWGMSGAGVAGGNNNAFALPTAENFQNVQNLADSTARGHSADGVNNNERRSPTQAPPPEYSDRLAQQQAQSQPEDEQQPEDNENAEDQDEPHPEPTIPGQAWYMA